MKTSELIKLLKRAKYRRIRNGSRHDIWYSPMTNREFPVTIFPFFSAFSLENYPFFIYTIFIVPLRHHCCLSHLEVLLYDRTQYS